MRGRSLSRSTSRRGRKRPASRSTSSLVRSTDGNDHRRAWSYGQTYSRFFDPFPGTMRAVLRYSETAFLNPGAGGTAHALWRANSIYDPNYTLGGHQPYGHDTFEAIYNHYRVIKATAKVTWLGLPLPAQLPGAFVGITITDDASVSGTYDTVREVKPTKYAVMNSSVEPVSLNQTFVADAMFGKQAGDKLTAKMGGDPADQAFFDVWAQASNPTEDLGTIQCVINIAYYVEFSELRDLGQS